MPIFEYLCRQCGSQFEKLLKSSTAADPACPVCHSEQVVRKLSTFAATGCSRTMPSSPGGG